MGKLSVLLVLVASIAGVSVAAKYSRSVSYEGELVVRCDLEQERLQTVLNHNLVDVWKVSPDGGYADLRMHNDLYEQMRDKFPECKVLHPSVEVLVREAEMMMKGRLNATWFEEYHKYDEIVKWYQDLADNNKYVVTYVPSIGKSVEGRDQPAVHITTNSDADMKIYFQCQIHAREWISGATCMYIASYLVENYEKNEEVTNLLKELEFIFVPFVNPDGYEYTWTNNRLWRKNRRPGSLCDGVDLNRNYDDHWGEEGSSGNECSDTYHGPSAASEPETQNAVKYFKANGPIIGAIDWHSYSQLILRPYGWTNDNPPDEPRMLKLGADMASAIEAIHGKKYISIKAIDLYAASGTASDWFYSDDASKDNGGFRPAGITIELRDTGQYGFMLPPDQIIPTGEEIVPAVMLFAKSLLESPLKYPSS